jgi:hypothetical protein
MAFHSKGGSASTFGRSHRRDKESILGLSGWLFADLLLAIAIVFLVVQETPGDSADAAAPTTTTSTTVPAVKSGLIADPAEQLIITVPDGARVNLSAGGFRDILKRNLQIKFGQSGGSADTAFLRDQNYRIGFVIWFAGTTSQSERSHKSHFGTFVNWLLDEGLVVDTQLIKSPSGDFDFSKFPSLSNYTATALEGTNDVLMRVFLFKSLQ